jgi:COPII coat assembly protein SEC16
MGLNTSDDDTAASWHPALRPNDDHQRATTSAQPVPRAMHGLDSHPVESSLDNTSNTTPDTRVQTFPDSADEVRQDVSCAPTNRPHDLDVLGTQRAERNSSSQNSAYSPQLSRYPEDSVQSKPSAEGFFDNGGVSESLPRMLSTKNDGVTSGMTGLVGEGTEQHVAHNERSELSSDEDDERLDSLGGITRSVTLQMLKQVERTSSFPALSLEPDPENMYEGNQVPGTKAEAVTTDVETDMLLNNDVETSIERSEQAASETTRPPDEQMIEEQEDSFFERLASTNQTLEEPTNAEARFEEGLLLIDSESRPNDEMQEHQSPVPSAQNQMWSSSPKEDEAKFFDHPSKETAKDSVNNSSGKVDRKATFDVYRSLDFSSGQAPDSPADQPSNLSSAMQYEDEGARKKVIGGEGGASKDVSALWDAVLDDEDFLAEDPDDLLSDSSPESTPDSPSSFLGSLNDGTGFQEPDEILSRYDSRSPPGGSVVANNDQGRQVGSQQTTNTYAPHQPSSSDLAQLSPTTYGNVGLSRPNLAPLNFGQNSFQGQLQRPAAIPKAESFVDQSKGGYKSPYDLPMDLSKPRKRVQMHQPTPAPTSPAPPPRSSSMTSDQPAGLSPGPLQSPFLPAYATFEGQPRPLSSQRSAPLPSVNRKVLKEQPNTLNTKASSSSFFEELPITTKPRPPTAQGRYTPLQTGPLPPQIPTASSTTHRVQSPTQMPPPPPPLKPSSTESYSQYQLQRPERLDPYANVPLQPSAMPVIPTTRYSPAAPTSQTAPLPSRYSPAPPSSQMAPPPAAPSRYSPAPPPQPNVMQTQNRYASQQPPHQLPPHNLISQSRYPSQAAPPGTSVLPFQPRTSSPLAYHGKKSDLQGDVANEVKDQSPVSPPRRVAAPEHNSPRKESPPSSGPPMPAKGFAPPRRSQTQSPGKRGPLSSLTATSIDTTQRPASVHGPSSPITSANAYQSFPPARPSIRQRGLSQNLNFISPTDDSKHDELQRWRGSPLFRFGLGGSTLTTFPKHIPRYTAGSATPMIKPMAGEVQVRNAKEMYLVPEHISKFPGPLRSKSKKKEVIAWLSDRIGALESMPMPSFSQQISDPVKRHEERVLLWQVVRVIVEHDGAIDGNVEAQKAMNLVLSPASASLEDLPSTNNVVNSGGAGIYKPSGFVSHTENTDPAAVESVRRHLLRGEREKAVWAAVDNRLWAHAMLLSSTLERSIWKQVAHEFVRQEVKLAGANTEPLAALYEVFAGNLEESVDELVPASARAGLQMVSKVGSAPTKSALDGLDRWRETLGLILNNRSPEDQKALAALGRLLASYGRIEASHICHLFSVSPMLPNVFGGADDPQASIVLLGADHRTYPIGFFLDEDAILLTEVYEFASSVLAINSRSTLMPHLQAYKLQRAKSLAEAGFKTEAQAYCDAMGACLRSTTKMSPYYHPQFLAELDDLTQCLSQSPTEPSSWISKPSMGKVSGSMWNKFTNFVAGDESDAASTGSGRDTGHETGPFAKVTGTPTISRSGSSSDLYATHVAAASQPTPNTIASSRYAPSGQLSARSSSELTRGRPSLDSQRSPLYLPQGSTQRSPYDPNGSLNQQSHMSPPIPMQSGSPYVPLGTSPPVHTHQVTPPQTSYMPIVQSESQVSPYEPRQPEAYISAPPLEQSEVYMPTFPPAASEPHLNQEPLQAPSFGSHMPADAEPKAPPPQLTSSCTPPSQSYGSYEPPSSEYIPYQPDPSSDSDSDNRNPKNKSFVGGDDDIPSYTVGLQNNTAVVSGDAAAAAARKKANDEAAEAAFRAAAEADAAKDKPSTNQDKTLKAKPSWFGGLFSRKEADSLDAGNRSSGGSGSGEGQKVIRAKLGEESSFYYDKELKKWVNKKDPGSMQQSAKATPPPPKGPIGRVVSESLGSAGAAGPPRSGLAPPSPSLSSSRPPSSNGPPSRAATPSEAGFPPPGPPYAPLEGRESAPPAILSSGAAAPLPPPTSRPASTALSTASDIDDLLGGPPTAGGRKAGGTLKGKKGRAGAGRYVDVMAK